VTFAPDYCEPIVGWRTWHAVERRGETYLTSWFHQARWTPLEPLVSVCEAPRFPWFRRRPRHTAPTVDCTCGIYATTLEKAARYVLQGPSRPFWPMEVSSPVLGEVALWGDVVECTQGWRASVAYPRRLFVIADDRRPKAARLMHGLERYGVPVDVIAEPAPDDPEVIALLEPFVGRAVPGWSTGVRRSLG
jgi:hypothetical protein